LQFHVNKTAKDSSLFAVSISCTFSAKRLQNHGIYFCKDAEYEGCWSIAPKNSKTCVLAEAQHLGFCPEKIKPSFSFFLI